MDPLQVGVVSALIGSVATLIGTELFKRRPRLVVYFGHVATFIMRPPEQATVPINTHSVVLRNSGRKAATNVRVTHQYLPPDVLVWPTTPHLVHYYVGQNGANGGDIIFDKLVPSQQVTISYMYFPPLTASQINSPVRSDEGFAKAVSMELQPQQPKWVLVLVAGLMLTGAAAWIYWMYRAADAIWRWSGAPTIGA